MDPVQAIRACFAKSFHVSGRPVRSEFCWMAGIWVLLSILLKRTTSKTPTQVNEPDIFTNLFFVFLVIPSYLILVVLLNFPLVSAVCRIFQDLGLPGRIFAALVAMFIVFPTAASVFPGVLSRLFRVVHGIGPSIAAGIILMCFLPARTGPNSCGPNPLEASK